MNRGNPNYYLSGEFSLKPALVIFAISSSPKEDVPSPHASRHLLPDKEFKSHRSASPKSPELEPTILKESRVDTVGLSKPRVLKVRRVTLDSSELLKNQITEITKEGEKLVSPRVLKVTPYPILNISQLPEGQRLEIIKKRESAITIPGLQASSGSSILNATMHQETKVSRREEAKPNNTRKEVTGTLVYATKEIPERLSPAGFLLRPEGSQVQKEKQSCFSGCIIS